MIRLIKADIYRILRTKGFYITMFLIVAYVAVTVSLEAVGAVGINVEDALEIEALEFNLETALQSASTSSSFLVYLLISIFVIIFGYEFSQRTYKNSLTSGVTRLTFVLSKYLVQLLFFFSASIIYFGSAVLCALVKYGRGDTQILPFLWENFLLSLAISLVISVIFSLASLILVSTGSLVLSSVFVVVYPMLIQLFSVIFDFEGLKYLNCYGLLQEIGLGVLSVEDLLPYAVVSFAVIVLSLTGSTFIIQHKEL